MKRPFTGWLVAALLASSALCAPTAQAPTLRPTFGGVLLEARLLPGNNASLSGAWSDTGRARLMRCAPRCSVVKSIPLDGPMTISQSSMYRVVLGGTFKPGQRVKVLLRFGQAEMVTLEARVAVR
ncbi:hypothetical protein [Deinococcus sp.]|uniref:hypothetical protein n=1 Tax=Deinococcus sp. TaxID=47478 RepID=UPI003B5CC1A4